MPKIALAITGFPRTFDIHAEPVRRFILDKYPCDTFAAIYEPCNDLEYERITWPYTKRSYFRNAFLGEFSEYYRPIRAIDCQVFVDELPRLVRDSSEIPHSTGRKYAHRAIYSQTETWKKTGELIRPCANEYDLVIKYRTDILIRSFDPDLEMIARSNDLYVSSSNAMGWEVGPHGEVHGGICELMWICRPEIHIRAVSLFDHIVEYAKEINSCHAEKLFGHHLKKMGITVKTFSCDLTFPDVNDIRWGS